MPVTKPKGLPKTGGRKKGTPNKNTLSLLQRLQELDFDLVGELIKGIQKQDGDRQVDSLLKLMEFIYPKRKPLEDHSPQLPNSIINNNVSPEQMKELLLVARGKERGLESN